ncbi:MAG: hypothetical protein JJ899_00925 [Alphaproteobacteria bacterium]|nr:hypothetical protein [Alphaproteobacteria bacterium]
MSFFDPGNITRIYLRQTATIDCRSFGQFANPRILFGKKTGTHDAKMRQNTGDRSGAPR